MHSQFLMSSIASIIITSRIGFVQSFTANTNTNPAMARVMTLATSRSNAASSFSTTSTSLNMKTDSESGEKLKNVFEKGQKGNILVLGGSGFLGGTVARRAILEGYSVTSISRRGRPETDANDGIDYRIGDARKVETIQDVLNEEGKDYKAVIHCIGLLFDGDSGIGNLNRFVSGSGSVPDDDSSYDDITRLTSFNAIQAAEEFSKKRGVTDPLPFIFTSAAEAGWPDVTGGPQVERFLAPEWLKRYLKAKREVEARLSNADQDVLRPVIFRPSLIYSLDRIASLPPVGAFFVGNKIGLPFVDRPVTVQALSSAVIRSLSKPETRGVQRFMQVDELSN